MFETSLSSSRIRNLMVLMFIRDSESWKNLFVFDVIALAYDIIKEITIRVSIIVFHS